MNAVTAAGMERLQRVLDAPVTGPSIHQQVNAIAHERAEQRPRDVTVKQLAAPAEPVPDTATGEFVALISDYEEDRQGERFPKGAFDAALSKIRQAGRALPVLFGHDQSSVHAVVGMVPHDGLWADDEGLWARGQIDTTDQIGMKLHRMIKSGALQWSIGFCMPKGFRPRVDHNGVRVLDRVDEILELSVVGVPANSRTRTVGIKSTDPKRVPSLDELRARERELGLDPEADRIREQMAADIRRHMDGDTKRNGKDKTLTPAELKAKAERVAAEHGPLTVATFDC